MTTHCRTVFLSDLHLGTREAQARHLDEFLAQIRTDSLYLVGDILDLEQVGRRWKWRPAHQAVLRRILAMAADGTRVTYLLGNHDRALAPHLGRELHGIPLRRRAVHRTAGGLRLLIAHGDEFEREIEVPVWLRRVGDLAYLGILWANRHVNHLNARRGRGYRPLSQRLKSLSRAARAHISHYEARVVEAVREHDVDGIVCGHIHVPRLRLDAGMVYANTGDWVESCTALVEKHDGALELLRWTGRTETLATLDRHALGGALAPAPAYAFTDDDGELPITMREVA